MKDKNLILIGGGGHCRSVIDVAECAGYTILGVLDKPEKVGEHVLDYEVVGTDDDMAKYIDIAEFVVTVGQIKSPDLRMALHQRVEKVGGRLATVISPTACVSRCATVGEGTVVMHQAVVNAGAKIGKGCIINTFADVEHDSEIGDFCHISTGAIVNGGCKVGKGSFLGTGALIANQIEIGENAVIGAGTVVVKSLPSDCIVYEVPSKVMRAK
jgi:sugar O-acyltransferase (sialic acid O-acetyltransferase NeuD family)